MGEAGREGDLESSERGDEGGDSRFTALTSGEQETSEADGVAAANSFRRESPFWHSCKTILVGDGRSDGLSGLPRALAYVSVKAARLFRVGRNWRPHGMRALQQLGRKHL